MINIAITGCSGFIGKKTCLILKQINNFKVFELNRDKLKNIDDLLKKNKIHIFIHLIHDFKNQKNNIEILQKINNCFKNNYYPNKFIYLSSWVTIFKIGYNDSYYLSKIECEKYITNNIKNYIILRPSLVCSKNNIWTNKYILYLSYGYYVHVNELIYIIIDYIYCKNVNIISNIKSHYYNKNILTESYTKNIRIIPKTFGFFIEDIKFDISLENVSYECLLYQNIKSIDDIKWIHKYFKYDEYEICGYKNSFIIQKNYLVNCFNMTNYNKIIDFNNNTIIVESGISLTDILIFLKKYNRTIDHIPFFCDVSAGSCLKTNIHGISSKTSCVASCIKEFVVINKNTLFIKKYIINEIKNINYDYTILTVTFNTIPLSNIKIETLTLNKDILDIDENIFKKLFYNNYACCLNWHKYDNKTHLTKYNLTDMNKTTNYNFVRRHIPFFNKHIISTKITDYNSAFNEYKFILFEKYFIQNINIVNIELFFPITKYNDFKQIIKNSNNNITSIFLRFTNVDNIIYFPNTNIICWSDIIVNFDYSTKFIDLINNNNQDKLFNFHSGKYNKLS
jgi:hypothetical protein